MSTANQIRNATAEWVDTFEFDARLALAAAEAAGVGVDGLSEPLFYEIKAPFLSTSSSMGAVMGMVGDEVAKECRRYGVEERDISALRNQIQRHAMGGSYNEGLALMMRWVGVDTGDEDD